VTHLDRAGFQAALASEKTTEFFRGNVRPWHWGVLAISIVSLLAADLALHRDDKEPTAAKAFRETLVWVSFGLMFSGFIWWQFGGKAFSEYLSGYVIEESLSIDNVFVWALAFGAFAIPLRYQHRVLFWGIFGALIFRAAFIFAGAALIQRFWVLLLIFGAFLVYTGAKIILSGIDDDDETDETKTRGLSLLKRFLPVTDQYDGKKFITRENGRKAATPLLACLVVVEVSDIVFAVDSVPAILAVSREQFIVFSSNAFAILGLRALYFVLADAKERFKYLPLALGIVLVFVGVKMVVGRWFHINTWLSLAVIVSILTAGVFVSLRKTSSNHAT
jgi:tellurite resistance protein TerC